MRIVVVEDEEKIRKGIVRLIHKLSEQYRVVGECENGLEGIASIKRLNPDLVITDIRMPLMGGMDMLETLKGEGIAPRTIILSGYSEFEFARKALQLGVVVEYLLKPITADDFKQVLLHMEADLANRRADDMKAAGADEDGGQWFRRYCLQPDMEPDQAPERVKQRLAMNGPSARYLASVYTGQAGGEQAEEARRTLQTALELDDRVNDFLLAGIPELCELNLALTMKSAAPCMSSLWEHLLAKLRALPLNDAILTWEQLAPGDDLRERLRELRGLRKWSLLAGGEAALNQHKAAGVAGRGPLPYPAEWEPKIKEAVLSRDRTGMKRETELFAEHCMREAADPQQVLDACIRFLSAMQYMAGVILGDASTAKEWGDLYHRLSLAQTPRELREALLDAADRTAEGFASVPVSHSLVINKAVKRIQERYQTGITLEELAGSFGITPEYLSSLFQKELGVSFTACVKNMRIRKAKELLAGNRLKAFEVAQRVGYSDAKYFSRVFKEATGLTPGEFQRLHR
ncbi:HTH-type transcriptional regulator YesS [Paenibacillus konkukensis]|uniref:HTH-type transcriptional regulator YesS n=1 Tax=Paenibacillus konkukensis TaxID=2020716 RepID=A0ABY4RT98_9BACL|nr:response regulator [Paenibacillus konkukensis]UQZ85801.1 HTH-type transcriptional regulator YesS [Paenibacillus konkukensis]